MNKQKQELINRMENLQSLIPDTIQAINELPEVDFNYQLLQVLNPGELQINMKYNILDYTMLRRGLGKSYKFVNRWFHSQLGSYFFEFKHKSLDVILDIQMKLNKLDHDSLVSCGLVLDGHTISEPIYRVECE